MIWPFGNRKPSPLDHAILTQAEAEVERASEPSPREQAQAELDAIQPPDALYLIGEDIKIGTWSVKGWAKGIDYGYAGASPWYAPTPRVYSGYDLLVEHLRSKTDAERWLAAHVEPEKHRTAYDAEGKRIEVNP